MIHKIKICKAQGSIICVVCSFAKTKRGTCKSLDLIFIIEAFNCFQYKKQDGQHIVHTIMKREEKCMLIKGLILFYLKCRSDLTLYSSDIYFILKYFSQYYFKKQFWRKDVFINANYTPINIFVSRSIHLWRFLVFLIFLKAIVCL